MKRIVMAMAMAAGALAGGSGETQRSRVPVCTEPFQNIQARFAARGASRIFAGIGIELDWQTDPLCPQSPEAVSIGFSYSTPDSRLPGALAYALPYEGTHIVVFYDRVTARAARDDMPVNALLAYVMAHEITHILKGVDVHSPVGIMKGEWTSRDRYQIKTGRLAFTAEDIQIIYLGVAVRKGRVTGTELLAAR